MKRRVLIATLAAGVVFAAVIGMAASLGGISGASLGSDDAVVGACDSDGVTTAYTNSYSASGTAGYKVGNLTVGNIAAGCNGKTMKVTLTGAANASLGEQSVTVAVGGADTSDTLNFTSAAVLAQSVTGVHVVIGD
jgi:hypothetical protein